MREKISRQLKAILRKTGGRDSRGQVSTRHHGGGSKRFWREIDFYRSKKDIVGTVESIEYDPNRNLDIARIVYPDGERRYILAPEGLKIDDEILASEKAEAKVGNCLPLKNIPLGIPIHNLTSSSGQGRVARGAGTLLTILAKEEGVAQVKLPSGEIKLFPLSAWATVGQLGNTGKKLEKLRKAGDSRHRGIRPTVRGVAQDPHSHPHGGGEGRSGIGMPGPKTPWGKPALGKKTRKKGKYSDKFIIKRRK